MKNIELFNEKDLREFESKTNYFLNPHLEEERLPMYSSSYSEIANQVKLSEFISKIDLKDSLVLKLKNKILTDNDKIVDYLEKIKSLQGDITSTNNILESIGPLKSFKSIFKLVIKS